jgi:hypothetical protein
MTKPNLKLVLSTPIIFLSTISRKLNFFKKIRFNSFVGGLIFGAIFSLVVNVVTIQVQEIIQKQRILEALENEIMSNTLLASRTTENNNTDIQKKEQPNIFHPFFRYTDDLWTQSTEPLQYVAQLDQETQISVSVYYTITLKHANNMVEKYDEIARKKLENCYEYSNLTEIENEGCKSTYWTILGWETDTALQTAKYGYEVLEKFHPTKDRQASFVLSLLMGKESTRILSRE